MDAPGTRSKTIAWARVTLQIPCHCSIGAATTAAHVAMISRNSPNAWRQIAAIFLSRMILRLTNSATTVMMRCGRQLGGCLNEGKFRVRVKPFHLSRGPSVEARGARCCPGVRGRDLGVGAPPARQPPRGGRGREFFGFCVRRLRRGRGDQRGAGDDAGGRTAPARIWRRGRDGLARRAFLRRPGQGLCGEGRRDASALSRNARQ
jgi:hypothetical protein